MAEKPFFGLISGILEVRKSIIQLHPGQCASIKQHGVLIGWLGALHPQVQKALDIDQKVYLFELKQSAIADNNIPAFSALSRYPEVRRDLAVLVDEAQDFSTNALRFATIVALTVCAALPVQTLAATFTVNNTSDPASGSALLVFNPAIFKARRQRITFEFSF